MRSGSRGLLQIAAFPFHCGFSNAFLAVKETRHKHKFIISSDSLTMLRGLKLKGTFRDHSRDNALNFHKIRDFTLIFGNGIKCINLKYKKE